MKGDFTRLSFDPTQRYTAVLKQQGRVDLDADWNEEAFILRHLERTEAIDVIGPCGAPKDGGGLEVLGGAADGSDLNLSAGRIYVDGILCELDEATTYLGQADLPDPPAISPADGRTDLVYLDVWERHVTAIEAPDVREVGLGGPDTTTRLQTVWQVRVQADVPAGECGVNIVPPDGKLTATAAQPTAEADPCIVPAAGGYRGLENRLYRVEIHDGSDPGPETFKWSRDNGAIVIAVEQFFPTDSTKVKVQSLGRDQILALRKDDWVEVLDDNFELLGQPGTIAQITDIDQAQRILTLSKAISGFDSSAHPRVRRWDQPSDAIPLVTGTSFALEDGIEITFSGTEFRSGAYWTFAARTATASIDEFVDAAPEGIQHHYCALALVTWLPDADGDWDSATVVQDCRPKFPPLTSICAEDVCFDDANCDLGATTVQEAIDALCQVEGVGHPPYLVLRHVGGDGQEGAPDQQLPCLLVAGVEDEEGRPAPEVRVRFQAVLDDLLTDDSNPSNQGNDIFVTSDGDGLVRVGWTLLETGDDPCHQVIATLPAAPQSQALPVHFFATVAAPGEEPRARWPLVVEVNWPHGGVIPLNELLENGLLVQFSKPMMPATISPGTFIVTLEAPVRTPTDEYGGHMPLILFGSLNQVGAETWVFVPDERLTPEVLEQWLQIERELFDNDSFRVRITLKASQILDEANQPLDGEAFTAIDADGAPALQLPSGDGRQGGDFESWFFLTL